MSWGVIYRLPWAELDTARIQAAARAVVATLPGALLDVKPRSDLTGRVVSCYFGLPLSLARMLEPTPADLDREVASAGPLGIADPPWVQIDFVADDEEWPAGSGRTAGSRSTRATPGTGCVPGPCRRSPSVSGGTSGCGAGRVGKPTLKAAPAISSSGERERTPFARITSMVRFLITGTMAYCVL